MKDDFEELVRRNEKWVVAYLRRFVRVPADAYDLAQETFTRVWKRVAKGPLDHERAYIQTTAFHVGVDHCQREKNVPTEELEEPRDERRSMEDALIERETQARFNERFTAAYDELNELTRLCITLRRRGCSGEEIAATLGLDHTAVRSRLSRAKKHFRERVGEPPAGIEWLELPGEEDDDDEN